MARQLTPDGKFWFEQNDKGIFEVGFTETYLNKIGSIWTFCPRSIRTVSVGQSFGNVETTKRLMDLRSPVAGEIIGWPAEADPESITAETPLLQVKGTSA